MVYFSEDTLPFFIRITETCMYARNMYVLCLGDEREETGKQTIMYQDKHRTYMFLTLGKVTVIPFADGETNAQHSKVTCARIENSNLGLFGLPSHTFSTIP